MRACHLVKVVEEAGINGQLVVALAARPMREHCKQRL